MFSFIPLEIVALSATAAVVVEVLTWLLVYRTSGYRRLVDDVERTSKREEKKAGDSKKENKKQKRLDGYMKLSMQEMFFSKLKVGAINMVILISLFKYVSSHYKGQVAAKLPFAPFKFMQKLTHSSLEGEDYSECAAVFIYVLCASGIRTNVVKLLNLGPSRAVLKHMGMNDFMAKFQKQA